MSAQPDEDGIDISRNLNTAFDSFNARFLSPEQVASSFVPPKVFDDLITSNNTVLRGPRGSGKTTLLKMLQPAALAAWDKTIAEEYLDKVDFTGIFVGADVLWSGQLRVLGSDLNKKQMTGFQYEAFRIHLGLAFLDAIEACRNPNLAASDSLRRFHIFLSKADEAFCAQAFARIWDIDPIVPSLLGVRTALDIELSGLARKMESANDTKSKSNSTTNLGWLHYIKPAIDVLNSVLKTPNRKWALLLDELEITPPELRQSFFEALRSSDQRLLFKLAFFPHSEAINTSYEGDSPPTAAASHDFENIPLTYPHKEDAYPFCKALLQSLIVGAGATPPKSVESIFGDGFFDGGRSSRRSSSPSYAAPQGMAFKAVESLMRKDESFKRYVRNKKIDIRKMDDMSDRHQAGDIRKAISIVYCRNEYLKDYKIDEGPTMRSRKSLRLYAGTYSIFALSEGNPRTFINLVKPMVRMYARSPGTISVEDQARQIGRTIQRFKASLAGIPYAIGSDGRHVLDLVISVGRYFLDEVYSHEFQPEPVLSFSVDRHVDANTRDLLTRAVNLGVIIEVPQEDSLRSSSQPKRKFRLAYTLSPDFRLPLNLTRFTTLTNILKAESKVALVRHAADQVQLDLWAEFGTGWSE